MMILSEETLKVCSLDRSSWDSNNQKAELLTIMLTLTDTMIKNW